MKSLLFFGASSFLLSLIAYVRGLLEANYMDICLCAWIGVRWGAVFTIAYIIFTSTKRKMKRTVQKMKSENASAQAIENAEDDIILGTFVVVMLAFGLLMVAINFM